MHLFWGVCFRRRQHSKRTRQNNLSSPPSGGPKPSQLDLNAFPARRDGCRVFPKAPPFSGGFSTGRRPSEVRKKAVGFRGGLFHPVVTGSPPPVTFGGRFRRFRRLVVSVFGAPPGLLDESLAGCFSFRFGIFGAVLAQANTVPIVLNGSRWFKREFLQFE